MSLKRAPIPFGKYLLLDRVNIGGMAEVWRAKSFGAGGFERVVAIKRILPNIAEDAEFISMFIDEAKITVQLNHANIAQIYELSHVQNSYFIAMEYISGKDLRAVFDRCRKRGEPAPIPLTCYAIAKCCEGLDYAHRASDGAGRPMNIVHRDVSPQNLLVSYDGEIKVIDFGIAKAAGKATKTQAGILKGKFGYMSPEQIRGLPLDRRSDVFAIGICLYEMLTGERLFVGDSDFSVLEKVRKVEVLPPTTYNRRIPEALEKIVMKALARDVEERYQYASEVGEALQRFLITSEAVFGRKDLAQYMKSTFAEEFEREKTRLKDYADVPKPEGVQYGDPDADPSTGEEFVPERPVQPPAAAPARGVPPRGLATGVPAATPMAPPRSTPSIKLTAVAPMLTNDKDSHQSTQLVQEPPFRPSPPMPPSGLAHGAGRDAHDPRPTVPTEMPAVVEDPGIGLDATLASPSRSNLQLRDEVDQADQATVLGMATLPQQPPPVLRRSQSGAIANPLPRPDLSPESTVAGSPGRVQAEPAGRSAADEPASATNVAQMPEPRASVPAPAPTAKAPSANLMELLRPYRLPILAAASVLLLVLVTVLVLVLGKKPEGLLYIELPDAPGLSLNVNGQPLLEDDGSPIRPGPKLKRVPAGKVTVMVLADGYETFVETVEVKEGTDYTRLNSSLKKKP
ncbi:MAG: protein kinase [Myxococcaceae bacterium]|nr:protein kinase [Myxococcaceae bacterium]